MTEPTHDLSRLRIDRDRAPNPSRRRNRRRAAAVGGALVVIAGVVVWQMSARAQSVKVASIEVVGGAGAANGGSVGITANGYVVARTKASVSSKVSGRLAYLGVTEGSHVRRGDVIARLENADYQAALLQARADSQQAVAALAEAEAQRDQARRDLARAKDLLTKNLTSEQQVETLGSTLDQLEARVRVQRAAVAAAAAGVGVAYANLENTYIRAPFDGTVLRKDAEVGEVVAPIATGGGLTRGAVVTMANLETLEVEVDVNEAYIGQLHNGQPARIVLDAYPSEPFHGTIRQIVPTADRQRATVLVKVSILDHDPRILPEMATRVDFLSDSANATSQPAAARLFAPAAAVRDDAGQAIVWVVRDGHVHRVSVDAGPVSGDRREIRRGLSGGEQVVIEGPTTLKDGDPVTITPQ